MTYTLFGLLLELEYEVLLLLLLEGKAYALDELEWWRLLPPVALFDEELVE